MATIRRRGSKWEVQIRRKGQKAISRSFLRKKDADEWSRHIEIQADRSELPPDPAILKQITLAELIIRYRDAISIKKKRYAIEAIVFNAFLRHQICSKKLSELSSADFAAYRDERLKTIKPSTLKREFGPLQNMFEIARNEWGLPLQENPLHKVKIMNTDHRRERRLKDGEFEKLVEAAQSYRNPYVLPIIRFAIETAMRRGEILAMQWDHIDEPNRSLMIPDTKNGYPRTIPLTKAALAVLDEVAMIKKRISNGCDGVPGVDDLVFPITANALRLSWQRLRRRAGMEDFHFHDLRHEAISRFFEMGLSVPEVALISGHRDMRMLFRYTHPTRQRVVEKMDKCRMSD